MLCLQTQIQWSGDNGLTHQITRSKAFLGQYRTLVPQPGETISSARLAGHM